MQFEFATSGRIIFGCGTVRKAADFANQNSSRVFVITGKNSERIAPLSALLDREPVIFNLSGEPSTDMVMEAATAARREKCDIVIGMGGGSAIDAGKAAAALLTNPGDLMDYLEVIGKAQPLSMQPAPCIAIPTTAGTGAEVTKNAVIESPEHQIKVSMRSPMMLPILAVLDPELTVSMPPSVTAATGMDALTQLIEAFVSNQSNPLTDGICREGIVRAARFLPKAFENGRDMEARENMLMASLFGGLALANAKLGAVHGFAAPIGGKYSIPHGLVCARLLSPVIKKNISALTTRSPDAPALARYAEVARILTGSVSATASDGIAWVDTLCKTFNMPSLFEYGLQKTDFPELAELAAQASSMKGNPIVLTGDELMEILLHG